MMNLTHVPLTSAVGNLTTPQPTTALTEVDGYCDQWSLWAMIPLAASVALLLVIAVIDVVANAGPTKGRANYGRPWQIIHLLLSLGAWTLFPSTVVFVFYYHVWTSAGDVVNRVACLETYSKMPVLNVFFALQGLIFFVAYRPAPFVAAVSELLFPADALHRITEKVTSRKCAASSYRPTILMVGGTTQGFVYLEVLKRALAQYAGLQNNVVEPAFSRPRVVLVDVTSSKDWVLNNAGATGTLASDVHIVPLGSRHPPSTAAQVLAAKEKRLEMEKKAVRSAADVSEPPAAGATINVASSVLPPGKDGFVPFALPELRDNEVDEIVLSPYLRRMPPIGDFLTPAAESKQCCVALLTELRRVLRPGGVIRVCEALVETIAFEDDLVEAGFTVTKATQYTGTKSGWIFYMNNHQYLCEATKPDEAATSTKAEREGPSIPIPFPADSNHAVSLTSDPHRPLLQNEPGIMSGGNTHATSPRAYVVMIFIQITFFIAAVAIASALASPLWVPHDVVPAKRVSSLAMNIALSYPTFAYLSRLAAVSAAPSQSMLSFFKSTVVREVMAMTASTSMSVLIYTPELILEIALASTSLSSTAKSIMGKSISGVIGIGIYKRATGHRLKSALSTSHCTKERHQALQDAVKSHRVE